MTVKTQATMSSLRVNQFLKAEQRQRYSANLEEEEHAQALRAMETANGETPLPEGTFPAPIREEDLLETLSDGEFDEPDEDEVFDEGSHTLVRSTTPSLPHPSTLELEESVYSAMEQSMTPMEASYDEFEESNDMHTPRGITPEHEPGEDSLDGQQPTPDPEVEPQAIATVIPKSEVETISLTGVEHILDDGGSDFTDSLPNLELIPSTRVEQSLDFLASTTKKPMVHHPPAAQETKTGDQAEAASDQPVHHVQDLQEVEESDLYAPICEETLLSNQIRRDNTVTAVERHRRDKKIYLTTDDSLDGYHDPAALATFPMKHVPSDELSGSESESNLDNVVRRTGEDPLPTPYEDPVELDRAGA